MKKYILKKGDCLQELKEIEGNTVDMILTDLPYGTTNCKWDSIIDMSKLWEEYNRIIKKRRGYSSIFCTTIYNTAN